MRRSWLSIAGLSLLLFALDQLYRVLHPEVTLVRASLVGLTALLALAPLAWLPRSPIRPWVGALAIFSSAFASVLLIQAGLLVSRSPGSGLVHVSILAAAYSLLDRAQRSRVGRLSPPRQRRSDAGQKSSSGGARPPPHPPRHDTHRRG